VTAKIELWAEAQPERCKNLFQKKGYFLKEGSKYVHPTSFAAREYE
jgi:hypothetical protein